MCLLLIILCYFKIAAQGPPITGDKPVMLGENSWVVKSLTEIRNTDEGNFIKAPLMVQRK